VSDFLSELREHWSDGYWWADRPLTLAVLAAFLTGAIGLVFAFLEARMRAKVAA
jgi:ABC-type Fe3+ transport system permease subunit